ncbi:MAG: metallophosphoesterase [Candidatus Hermodarchaeota archaeon]
MTEISPIILVVSDIHLGSLDSEKDQFLQFLRKIYKGVFGEDLKALLILGDFIDLCTDLPNTLLRREKIREILALLIEIKTKMNLIFVLGNHEISVIGDYDEKFNRRKEKYLQRFQRSDFKELFDNDLYCQYLLMKKVNNEDLLLLYDTRDQIEDDPIKKIKIDGLELDEDYRCLMTHGYQFDGDVYRFFVGQIWKSLISNKKFEIKETYDYFWNEIIKNGRKIKPITREMMIEDLANLKNVSLESQQAIFSELNYLEFNLIKANMRVMKKWEHASKPDYYFGEIKRFLEDDRYNLSRINHLIYGHSHRKQAYNGTVNNHPIKIVNDGSWQHTESTFVEIYKGGKIELRSYEFNDSL